MLRWLTLLLITIPAAAQTPQLAVLEGPPSGPARLRAYEEASLGTRSRIVRDQIQFLPSQWTGRAQFDPSDAKRARPEQTLGVPYVQLADGSRLFRYRVGAGAAWGWLLLRASGEPILLHELPGLGGNADPWADRFGLAPDGRHAVFAPRAGGLVIARLDGGVFASTGQPSRTVTTAAMPVPASAMPGASQLWFTTVNERLWRCPLADLGQPIDLTPPGPSDARLKEQLARAGDGRSIVFLFGPKDQQRLWRLGESGAALVLPPPASKYEEPGYLPETIDGPRMLLNHDGTRLLYTDGALRDEVHLLDVSAALPPVHLTSDPNFQPYIGTVILPSFHGQVLAAAIGDPNRFDDFAAAAGIASVVNLTQTAGNRPPFGSGLLAFEQVYTTANDLRLLTERTTTGYALRVTAPLLGLQALLEPSLTAAPILGLARDATAALLLRTPNGDVLRSGTSGGELLRAPFGVRIEREARGAGFGLHRVGAGAQQAVLFRLDGGGLLLSPVVAGMTQAATTAAGGLVVNDGKLRYFGPAGAATLPSPDGSILLSGLDS
jgi:hypothetical protein